MRQKGANIGAKEFPVKKLLVGMISLAALAALWLMLRPPVKIDPVPADLAKGSALIYFGAEDCPYCQAFKARDMAELKSRADAAGMRFVFREDNSLANLGKPDVFGDYHPVWLAVRAYNGSGGVPSFALVRDGELAAAGLGEWRGLMDSR